MAVKIFLLQFTMRFHGEAWISQQMIRTIHSQGSMASASTPRQGRIAEGPPDIKSAVSYLSTYEVILMHENLADHADTTRRNLIWANLGDFSNTVHLDELILMHEFRWLCCQDSQKPGVGNCRRLFEHCIGQTLDSARWSWAGQVIKEVQGALRDHPSEGCQTCTQSPTPPGVP